MTMLIKTITDTIHMKAIELVLTVLAVAFGIVTTFGLVILPYKPLIGAPLAGVGLTFPAWGIAVLRTCPKEETSPILAVVLPYTLALIMTAILIITLYPSY